MNGKTLLPDPSLIKLERFVSSPDAIIVVIKTKLPQASCSLCQQPSQKIHSRYVRRLADLPWQGVAIRVELTVRRFICMNDSCSRKIFAEQLPSIVKRYARKTARLNDALTLIGFAIGGEAGAKVAKRLSMTTSPDTLLRRLRQAVLVEHPTPKVLGVDDWAFRKGQRYGTILIDLEKRCPIDLLKDREAETLRAWLAAHPGVEIVSRDRASSYADAARRGAPDALQIADRWHLLKNLREAVELLLLRRHSCLKKAFDESKNLIGDSSNHLPPNAMESIEMAQEMSAKATLIHQQSRQRRLARYQEVIELFKQGVSLRRIAEVQGLARNTVRRWCWSQEFPERASPSKRLTKIDRYVDFLKRRWNEGCHNASQLWREVRQQGYRGSHHAVRRLVHNWQPQLPPEFQSHKRKKENRTKQNRPPSPRKTYWLMMGTKMEPEPEEMAFLNQLLNTNAEVRSAQELAKGYCEIVSQRKGGSLDEWIEQVKSSNLPELKSFVRGLKMDEQAVRAALEKEWSNGQTEGQVNRLKTIKRQMYGRANFDLLKARVLYRQS
jgi:transposase